MTKRFIPGGRAAAWLVASMLGVLLTACGGGGGAVDGAAATGSAATGSAATDAASVAVAADLPGQRTLAQASSADDPAVTNLQKISETRVGRTLFEYVFRITVQNGPTARPALVAQLTAAGTGTTILDGDVQVGDLGASGSTTPADTIRLRHDRQIPFRADALVWRFAGGGPQPASLKLDLAQMVLGAGTSQPVSITVRDAQGVAITPAPAVTLQIITPAEGTSGAPPTLAANRLVTDTTTRGTFTLRGTVSGTAVTDSIKVTVLQNAVQSANAGQYLQLSAVQGTLTQQLALATAASQRGDDVALAAAVAAIQAAGASIDLNLLGASTPYEPDTGFIPDTSKLQANGVLPAPGDAAFGAATAQLRSKLGQIRQLLTSPTGDDATDSALLAQYETDLAAILGTLASPAAKPGLHGMVQHASTVNDLIARDVPAVLKAMASRVQAQATPAKTAAAAGGPQAPRTTLDSGVARPAFLFGSLLGGLGPMGNLVLNVYGRYLEEVENAVILLGLKGLLDAELPQLIRLEGLWSGASQSVFAYNRPDSVIYLSGTTVAAATNADVYLIGSAAVDALGGAASALSKLPKNPRRVDELFAYFDGVKKAIDGVGQAYDLAYQPPSVVFADSFDNGGCLFALSDSCIEMHYNNGFRNVAGGRPFSFTVLMLVRTGGPRPQYGSALFNFAPNT